MAQAPGEQKDSLIRQDTTNLEVYPPGACQEPDLSLECTILLWNARVCIPHTPVESILLLHK